MEKEKLWTKEFLLANGIQFGVNLGYFMLYSTIGIYTRGLTSVEFYVGLVTGIFTFASLLTRLVSGRLLERFPVKGILIFGVCLSLVASTGYLFSDSVTILLCMRIANGLGYGLSSAAIATIVSSMLPPRRLLEGLGYSMMFFTLCGAVGPSLALNLSHSDAQQFGKVFIVTVLSTVLTAVLVFFLQRGQKQSPKETNGTSNDEKNLQHSFTLATGIFLVLTFLLAFGQSAVVACLNLYALDNGMGNLSLFFIIFAVANFLVRLFMNPILQVLSERTVLIGITVLLIGVYLGIFFADSAGWLYVLAVPFGAAMGFYYPLLTTKTIKTISKLRQGTSNSIYLASEDMGFFVGAIFWSAMAGVLGGYRQIYFIAACLAVCMLLIVLFYPAILKRRGVKEDVW